MDLGGAICQVGRQRQRSEVNESCSARGPSYSDRSSVKPATRDHTNLRCYHATSAHALTAFTAQIWAPEVRHDRHHFHRDMTIGQPEHTTALSWLSGPEELRLCTFDLARCLAARTQGHRTSSVIPRKTADINPMYVASPSCNRLLSDPLCV